MKFSVWDALSILALMGLCVVGIIVLTIFTNPASAFNPFPPPTLPASIVLPSDTPTAVFMPPTWTPVGQSSSSNEKVASQTPLPTSTGFVLPSFTPTFTNTPTPTNTKTLTPTVITDTPQPTSTHKPTRTPTDIASFLAMDDLSVDVSDPLHIVTVISINNTGTHSITGVGFANTYTSKTVSALGWTCNGNGGATCSSTHGANANFSISVSLPASSSITITINVKGIKSPSTESANLTVPSRYNNEGTTHKSAKISW